MSYVFPRYSFDNIVVKTITATNIQQNKVTQANEQFASARARFGQALANNTAAQNTPSTQIGSAFNNIGIKSTASVSDILTTKIDATNAQSNDVFQDSKQKALSTTWGYDPALNSVWQKASSYQIGSVFNNIDINT